MLVALAAAVLLAGTPLSGARASRAASTAPTVALLSTEPGTSVTELRFQPLNAALTQPAARFVHHEESTVLGAVLPGTRAVVATATTTFDRDVSFGSTLYLLRENQPAQVLAEHLAVSTRPLVSSDGRVFVQRGVAGPELEGQLRIDALTVDQVNPFTGAIQSLYSTQGYTAFLAGLFEREVLVYQVGPEGAAMLAVDTATRQVRVLVPFMLPFARDFAVDEKMHALYFTQSDSKQWSIERLDLRDGARSTVVLGPSMALLPTVFPSGALAFAPADGRGLTFLDGRNAVSPRGEGFLRVRAFAGDWVLGLNETRSDFAATFAVSLKTGRSAELNAVKRARLDIAGVVP